MVPNLRFPSFSHDWKIYTFDDIASYKKGPFGSALKKDLFVPKSKESVKVYEQQNAINKDCHLERYFISANYYEKMKSFTVYPGDTIVSCAGTIGELYTLPENADIGIINQALMIIRNNQAIILKDFLNIQFSRMIDEFSKTYSNGSAIKNIPPFSDLKRKKTYVPDKLEQEKIIKFISLLDQKITTQIKIIDSYFSLSKAISNTLIGQSKGNTRLRECLNCYSSNTMESVIKQEDLGDYPVYGANGIIKKINNYEIEYPSIAIVKDGSGVGKMFKLSGKYSILSTLNYLTSKPGYDIDYIYYALKQKSLKKYVVGSGIPHIYFKDYEQEKIYIPQNELQQQNITSVLQSIDEEIGNEIKQLKNYELLKKYLLKNMFV